VKFVRVTFENASGTDRPTDIQTSRSQYFAWGVKEIFCISHTQVIGHPEVSKKITAQE